MTIQTAFFTCLVITVIGLIAVFINMATAMHRTFKSGSVMSIFVVHIIAALFYILGGLGTVGFGIAWIVTYLKH